VTNHHETEQKRKEQITAKRTQKRRDPTNQPPQTEKDRSDESDPSFGSTATAVGRRCREMMRRTKHPRRTTTNRFYILKEGLDFLAALGVF
jgi:hypothetical protein